jgi:hypothetical protein
MRGGFVVESAQHTGASCFFKAQPYPELTLNRYLNEDTLRKHFPGSYFAGLEEVLSCLDATRNAYEQSKTLKDIAFLILRARSDFESSIDVALAGFNGMALDAMRDVMEIEYLLRDFLSDRKQIQKWLTADQDQLIKDFSPEALRRRYAKACGKTPNTLPDTFEYRAHSEGLHVSPSFMLSDLAGKGFTEAPSPRGVEFCFWDIFEHSRRVIIVANDLGKDIEGSKWNGPDPKTSMPEAAKAWERTRAMVKFFSVFERAKQEENSS